MSDPLIERAEVTALLFGVADINATLLRIEAFPKEADDEAEEDE